MLGVRAVGFEIEEHLCEKAARRLEQEVIPMPLAWDVPADESTQAGFDYGEAST